jgi:spore maturation protein CgeB
MNQKENYDPVRTNKIINSYRFTIKKLIKYCEEFLTKEKEVYSKLEDVSKLKRQYGKLLSSLR